LSTGLHEKSDARLDYHSLRQQISGLFHNSFG
jgi:hypothetical protein